MIFWAMPEDALKWNKGFLDRTIKNREEILSHFRETHPEFKTRLSEISLLKEYLKLMDNFSVENYNNIREQNE